MRVATYNRISKRELRRDGSAIVRQQWETARIAKQYDPNFLQFTDEQTGRSDDRPDFQKALRLIESKQIDMLIVSKIDRITRSVETNIRMAKLFERTDVKIYEILLGRTIEWSNPNDWSYFVNSGVKAEEEVRRTSQRIQLAFEWRREQGKPAGGGTPFGYIRSPEGFYAPDPENWDKAVRLVEILIEYKGTSAKAVIHAREELGLVRTRAGLYDWMRSATIRGYTRYKGRLSPQKTHPSLFDDPQLVTINAEREIDRLVAIAGKMKGRERNTRLYPLSGLVYCGRCGKNCHIKTMKSSKYPDMQYTYIMCGERQSRAADCGGLYGAYMGRRRTINTPYHLADAAVIKALQEKITEIVEQSSTIDPIKPVEESEESKKLRQQIAQLESLGDPDLEDVIKKKRQQWRDLMSGSMLDPEIEQKKAAILQYAAPGFFELMTDQEKQLVYYDFVDRVECDRDQIVVKLKL